MDRDHNAAMTLIVIFSLILITMMIYGAYQQNKENCNRAIAAYTYTQVEWHKGQCEIQLPTGGWVPFSNEIATMIELSGH